MSAVTFLNFLKSLKKNKNRKCLRVDIFNCFTQMYFLNFKTGA